MEEERKGIDIPQEKLVQFSKDWLRLVGFVAMICWMISLANIKTVLPDSLSSDDIHFLMIFATLGFCASLVCLSLKATAKYVKHPSNTVLIAIAVCGVLATVLLCGAAATAKPLALCVIGYTFAGAFIGYTTFVWGAIFSTHHMEESAPLLFFSVAAACFLDNIFVSWNGTLIYACCLIALPVVSTLSLKGLNLEWRHLAKSNLHSKRFMLVCLITPLLHGILMGAIAGVTLADSPQVVSGIDDQTALFAGVLFLVVAVYGVIVKTRLSSNIIHRPVVVLIFPALLMLPFALNADRALSGAIGVISILLFFSILLTATADVIDIQEFDPLPFLAVRMGSSFIVCILGIIGGITLATFFEINSPVTVIFIAVSGSLLVASSVISMEDQRAMTECVEQALSTTVTEGNLKATFAEMASELGLSPRESEVFVLLAQGRDPIRIQEILVVSYHTVRNHIKNIYRKLGVHSRQELVDLIEHKLEQK